MVDYGKKRCTYWKELVKEVTRVLACAAEVLIRLRGRRHVTTADKISVSTDSAK